MATSNIQKYDGELTCKLCDYTCSRSFCMQQHLSTTKHINATKKIHNATSKYACYNCDKVFKHHLLKGGSKSFVGEAWSGLFAKLRPDGRAASEAIIGA